MFRRTHRPPSALRAVSLRSVPRSMPQMPAVPEMRVPAELLAAEERPAEITPEVRALALDTALIIDRNDGTGARLDRAESIVRWLEPAAFAADLAVRLTAIRKWNGSRLRFSGDVHGALAEIDLLYRFLDGRLDAPAQAR